MAVANYDDFLAKLASPFQVIQVNKQGGGGLNPGRYKTLWIINNYAGVAPTTPVAPTASTVGGMDPDVRVTNPALNAYLGEVEIGGSLTGAAGPGHLVLYDRLSHQGGLSGTDTTVDNTTNLPTAALTRYTDGKGVMLAVEVYTAVGTTGSTLSCSYTNQDGTSGRTSPTIAFGTATTTNSGFLPLSLQQGDTGVRSIESYTLATSTGTVGNFGFTLYKPIAYIPIYNLPLTTYFNTLLGGMGQITEIVDDACLCWLWTGMSNGQPWLTGKITLIEA